jgi:hypothetical protein
LAIWNATIGTSGLDRIANLQKLGMEDPLPALLSRSRQPRHHNHARHHESLNRLTPADVYFGRAETILSNAKGSNAKTIANRRLQRQLCAA